MNVQVEHLENHVARLTVEVDAEMLNAEMRKVARRISKKARIPGFRPGKAPFNIVVNMFGYEYVLGETMEQIGDRLYREALDASEIEPYGPGSLENIEEGGQKIIFTVPEAPTVELGDYRAIRVDHEEQEVDDAMVDRAMENLRQDQAIVEDVERPARFGDQVVLSHVSVSRLIEDDELDDDETDLEETEDVEEVEASDEDAEDAEDTEDIEDTENAGQINETGDAGDTESDADEDDEDELDDLDDLDDEDEELSEEIFHQHNYEYVLFEDPDDEMLFPGLAAELVDAAAGDELEFYLEIPDDDEDEDIAGSTLFCEAHIEKVQARTVPDWTDDLAKRVSEDEFETILELRMDVRRQLEEQVQNLARQQIANEALEKMVEGATFGYPNEVVEDYVTDYVQQLEQNISRQGIQLSDWLRLTQQTEDELREQYREMAENRAKRTLALTELVKAEELGEVSDAAIEAEIDRMAETMAGSEQAAQFRQFLTSDFSRNNIANDLVTNRAYDRLVAIAKGENPPVGFVDEETTETTTETDGETDSEPEAVVEAVAETVAESVAETATEPTAEAEAVSDADSEAVGETVVETNAEVSEDTNGDDD